MCTNDGVDEAASEHCSDQSVRPDGGEDRGGGGVRGGATEKKAALCSTVITTLTILSDIWNNHFTSEETDCLFVVHSLISTM